MKRFFLSSLLVIQVFYASAQQEIKTGWNFGTLPSVAFDADLGFQYGALANIYFYGNGTTYPEYIHSIYLEAAYTTKNNGLFRLSFNSRQLIPNHEVLFDIAYTPDEMCDFYGFNGHRTVFNKDWTDDTSVSYRSRAFYKFRRDLLRVTADIDGTIDGSLKWNAGIGMLSYRIGSVNLSLLNKGKDEKDKLPYIDGLYEKYQQWGLIKQSDTNGGVFPYLRGGITYDTRNKTAAPSNGIWANAFLTYNIAFGNQKRYNNLKFNVNFCQYLPLLDDDMVFAYRLSTQLNIAGNTPFYMMSYQNNLFMKRVIYEGLGGANSLRGIMRSRAIAQGFGIANMELRIKLAKFDVGSQHLYIATNPFIDAGMILQPYSMPDEQTIRSAVELGGENADDYFDFSRSIVYTPLVSGGIGLKCAMNENFILSVDWAGPFHTQDAAKKSNLYIKMGYLF